MSICQSEKKKDVPTDISKQWRPKETTLNESQRKNYRAQDTGDSRQSGSVV